MPRPRKPTNVLEWNGAFKKNPQRRRVDPESGPLGDAPAQTPLTFEDAWYYLAACCPEGVLRTRDRATLELAAHLFVMMRNDPAAMPAAKLSQLSSCLARLGMSPVDASRVQTPLSPPERNEFDED